MANHLLPNLLDPPELRQRNTERQRTNDTQSNETVRVLTVILGFVIITMAVGGIAIVAMFIVMMGRAKEEWLRSEPAAPARFVDLAVGPLALRDSGSDTAPIATCWSHLDVEAQTGSNGHIFVGADPQINLMVTLQDAGKGTLDLTKGEVTFTGAPAGGEPDEALTFKAMPMSYYQPDGRLGIKAQRFVFLPNRLRGQPITWTATLTYPGDVHPENDATSAIFGPCPDAV